MDLIREVERNNIGRVRELLDRGADPNFRGSFGTALFEASHNGLTEMVRLLLDRGADPNIIDISGFTALSDAVNYSRNKTVELFEDFISSWPILPRLPVIDSLIFFIFYLY